MFVKKLRRRSGVAAKVDLPSTKSTSHRAVRDRDLSQQIHRVRAHNYGVYGARKVWLTLNREGPRWPGAPWNAS
jgi:hypothetical protein